MLGKEKMEKLRKIAERYNIEKIILFGSYAKGEETKKSDVDLIFIKNTKKRFLDRIDFFLKKISAFLKGEINLFVYTPEEFDEMKKYSRFINNILKEAKIIYESGKTKKGSITVVKAS